MLGFGPGSDDENEYTDDTAATPSAAPTTPQSPAPAQTQDQAEMTRRIFDKVVDIVNSSLPDFLARSVDPEREKQYMFDALDESMRHYILSLDDAARQRCEALWKSERDQLRTEMEKLKEQARQLEEKRSAMKERQLSADRQKRALSERVHDLEAQILKLEAEREQLELENKSLINKAKVANVYETELEEMRHRLAEATAGAPAAAASADAPQPDAAAIAEARKEAEQLRETIQKLQDDNERLQHESEQHAAEAKRLADAREAAEVKDRMDDAMHSELRKTAAEATARARELEAQCQSLQDALALAEAKAADAIAEAEARAQQAAGTPTQEQLDEIMAQVQRFSDVKDKLDRRIAQLKDTLSRSENENEQLRATIKNNLLLHAQQEKQMRDQIERLQAAAEQRPAADLTCEPAAGEGINIDDTTDIDDVIMHSDFLSSAPMPDRFPTKPKDDPDFGYTPPPKKPRGGDSDAQMTLF